MSHTLWKQVLGLQASGSKDLVKIFLLQEVHLPVFCKKAVLLGIYQLLPASVETASASSGLTSPAMAFGALIFESLPPLARALRFKDLCNNRESMYDL